jgi:glycosyltransferase involved in cell wall biosynthesis
MGVSAALIVRDEEEFIEGCLASLIGHVDQIVVVDTGSRDRTIEIASRFPVDVHHVPWRGDFSAARNVALGKATGDWILYIDADERLVVPSGAPLSDILLDKSKIAWRLRLYPRVGWTAYSELRLFRNDPRIRFEGAIHENLWRGISDVICIDGLEIGCCDLALHHLGYESDQRPKNPRNIPLLRERLSLDPDNYFCWWHLGECLRLAGDDDAAAETWIQGITRLRAADPQPQHLGHSLLYIALLNLRQKRGEQIADLLDEALALFPDNFALQFIHAQLAIDRGDLDVARPILERLADIDSETFFEPELAYDKALFGHRTMELLALCHFRSGRFTEAARLYRLAAQSSLAPAACELKARLAELRAG